MPQGNGAPGWLWLTRNPIPVAYWIPRQDSAVPEPIHIVMDERCFEDTLLRVERTRTHIYIADVYMWNGMSLYSSTTFEQRQTYCANLLALYTSCPAFETYALLSRADVPECRGYEHFVQEKGAKGVFVPVQPTVETESIVRTDIPDVYKLPAHNEYLRVKTLALSKHLRGLGAAFNLPCVRNEDGTWTPKIES